MSNALLVIDVQKEYQAGGKLEIKGFDRAAQNISKLLAWAREGNAAIFHFQHISAVLGDDVFAPTSDGIDFAAGFEPLDGERAYTKAKPSAFSASGFSEALASSQYEQVILCGFASFLCCDSTARDAYHRGYNVIFIEDAIGAFAFNGMDEEQLHAYTCAIMGLEFATVLKTRNLAP